MIKILQKIICPKSKVPEYPVQCSVCRMSFNNLVSHEDHIRRNNLKDKHKNKIIHIRGEFK